MKTEKANIDLIKEKLINAAKSAENPNSLVGHACWGYFAADVMQLIDDHSKIEAVLRQRTENLVATHPSD